MADYTALVEAGEALVELLRDNLTPEPISKRELISLCSPHESENNQLTVFLYHVEEDPHNNQAGFTSYSIMPMVLFFQNPNDPVRVDFLKIDPETFGKIMQSAVLTEIKGCSVKVPSLENLLAMKFHSLNESPFRGKDFEDIVWLSINNNVDEENVLRPLALKYATEEVYQQICERIHHEKPRLFDL